MKVLLTGGAGYIGSHTVVSVVAAGHEAVIVDNLCNSREEAVRRVAELAGRAIPFHRVDCRDREALLDVFRRERPDAVIHFAGLKAVGESVEQPLRYYHANLLSTIVLCEVMADCGNRNLVFSSSATVYGNPDRVPISEDSPLGPASPYGRTKLMIEQMLADLQAAEPAWRIALLRYFNPVGAHPSGRIGEHPTGIPSNLMPYITQVGVGRRPHLNVFGNDYPTPDGTCIRDYIHVVDLAEGHVRAIERLPGLPGVLTVNLGTGRGHSVLEVVAAFEQASGRKIPFRFAPRRAGDAVAVFADARLAGERLGWTASRGLAEMCADAWRWQSMNPDGYP